MIDMKLTGKRIASVCKDRGITVRKIQKELNIGAFQSVYNWFNGKTLPSLDNFYGLCKLLNVSMESLIVESDSWNECLEKVRYNYEDGFYVESVCLDEYRHKCIKRLLSYQQQVEKKAA